MNMLWAASGAVAGLPIGSALRGPVFRLADYAGADGACPACCAPVAVWAPLGCARCGAGLGASGGLELATAVVLALLAGRFAMRPELAAFAFLGVIGVALSAIDLAVQRLPDRLVLPAYPVLAALLAAAAAVDHDGGALARALAGGVALAGGYLLLALLRPGQLGGGDVKLAGLVGGGLAWLGWPVLVLGAALGFVFSGLASLALLATRRITLDGSIAFGPFLLAGALAAALVAAR